MTPFAQRILLDSILPKASRTFQRNNATVDVQREMREAHCFEFSGVIDLVSDLAMKMYSGWDDTLSLNETDLAFLPAPVTWLEFTLRPLPEGGADRVGYLVIEADVPPVGPAAIATMCLEKDGLGIAVAEAAIPLRGSPALGRLRGPRILSKRYSEDEVVGSVIDIYPMFAMINTPRVIGQRQHMPHAGLQRKLARAMGMVGKFPLQGWTEIKLEVRTPQWAEGAVEETHLTGAKALHFCRSFLRIRLGKLEVVRSHWRGDPALGIKRSRYVLTPPRERSL